VSSPKISFDDLYSDDKARALTIFLLWTNDFLDGFGIEDVTVDADMAYSYVSNLRKEDFPANGGFDAASPFKKAAGIYVWLHALNPFKTAIPTDIIGPDLAKFSYFAASAVGYNLIKCCLHKATLKKENKDDPSLNEIVILENPITISKHYFADLVEASEAITPAVHFKGFSLLFESLIYQNNAVSYPRVL